MLNPILLRTYCSLVETGNFTRTAEKLFMTQSGVSQHVRKLEESLSVSLLVRERKGLTLTDAGRTLYREGKDLLQSLENLATQVGQDPGNAGEVRVMSPGSVGLKLYPQLLALQERFPELMIDYRFAPNRDVEQAIIDDAIDIGLTTRNERKAEIRSQVIGEEQLLLVTPRDLKDPGWEALCSLGFIGHPDAQHHAELLLGTNFEEFRENALKAIPLRGFSNQIGLILEPVGRGLGFTVLPAHAVEAYPRPERIRAHVLENPVSEPLYLVSPAGRELPKRVKAVIEEIVTSIGPAGSGPQNL